MNIRPEKETEYQKIHDLVRTAFETAKVSNGDEQNFVTRLRAGKGYIPELALVAEDEDSLIGHIMLTHIAIDTNHGPHDILLLGPLAVAIDCRRRGVGARLVEEACSRAASRGHAAVILVGDPAYYRRFGFKRSVEYKIANANGIPDQYVMVRTLVSNALDDVEGTVMFQA